MAVVNVAGAVPIAYADLLSKSETVRISLKGLEVQFHQWGSGDNVYCLLHGGYGSWAHWIRVIPELAKSARVLVPDMPGFGASDSPAKPHTAESVAELLADAIVQIVPGQKIILAGFSFGGAIAGHVALILQNQVRHLMLIGPGGLGAPRGSMEELILRNAKMSREDVMAAHRRNLEILMVRDPDQVDALALFIQEKNTRQHRLKSRPISATDTLARTLSKLSMPLIFLFGECDATVGEYLPERLAIISRVSPTAVIEVIPDVGHWLMWERPRLVTDHLIRLAHP